MGKNVGLTYGEFKFPAEQGFTGSAGVHKVKGYMRGGHVKSPDKTKGKGRSRAGMPANVKAKGGYMKGGMHDKLKHEGSKMGYAYGGQVKDTSGEFVAKRGKQKTMDHGVQPAQTGRNQAENEAGGNKRLKAGYMKGGGVHKVRYSKKGMPKNVKAKGGLAKYAHGGYAAGDKKTHPKGKGRKPYTGYNAQAGGSGNEDARYMNKKKGGFIAGVKQYERTGKAPKGMKITGHSRQICMPVKKAGAAP